MKELEKYIVLNIKPVLNSHGGDIDIISYDSCTQFLKLRLKGQCCTCPLSINTSENLIRKQIFENFKKIKVINIESGVSDEMIFEAKNFFTKRDKL